MGNRIFHQGHFEIDTDCIVTESFTTTVFEDGGKVNVAIDESNNNYGVNLEFDINSAKKLINQLQETIKEIEEKEWISHFHCPDCEQCIDIGGKDLVDIFKSTIEGDDEEIHVYRCPDCKRTLMVAVEPADGKMRFKKILKDTKE